MIKRMTDLIRESFPKAKKEYVCNAFEWLDNQVYFITDEMTSEEKRIYEEVSKRKGKIQKGERYIKQIGIYEGEFSTFRAIPEIHEICLKYNLYYE